MKDEIYREPENAGQAPFVFDAKTASVFEDMVRRSVPGYGLTLEMIGVIARQVFAQREEGLCYDLGCSLGGSMIPVLKETSARVIGVDCSAEMLARAGRLLEPYGARAELQEARIEEVALQKSQLIILNFTLQFLAPESRGAFLKRCYDSLEDKGVLLLSEKIKSPAPPEEETLRALHHEFKAGQGYSALEIARKRDAIETVLLPESVDVHLARLREAGFRAPICWFQCFNFCSFYAEK